MKLRQYIDRLGTEGMGAYAERCGISANYLRIHVRYASKDPSVSLMRALAEQSQGAVTIESVLQHYRLLPDQGSGGKKAA